MKYTKYIVIGSFAFVLALYSVANYNRLVTIEENVNVSYAQYQNQLKRQADLIPNLAKTVQAYVSHEQKTMIDTAMARAGEIAKLKPSDVANNPELQKKMLETQNAMGRAMISLNAVREAYPNLKADKQFENLMSELSGTQNRVTVARGNNQKAVSTYNTTVRQFPRIIFAKVMGFNVKPYFEAGEENQNAPKLDFSK